MQLRKEIGLGCFFSSSELTEDAMVRHLENAQIEKLTVDRRNKKWHFSFIFEKITPCDVY